MEFFYKKLGKEQFSFLSLHLKSDSINFKNGFISLGNLRSILKYNACIDFLSNKSDSFLYKLSSKLDGLTHEEIKKNIKKVLKDIPIESYVNIFKGAYDRSEKYVKTTKPRVKKTKNYLE